MKMKLIAFVLAILADVSDILDYLGALLEPITFTSTITIPFGIIVLISVICIRAYIKYDKCNKVEEFFEEDHKLDPSDPKSESAFKFVQEKYRIVKFRECKEEFCQLIEWMKRKPISHRKHNTSVFLIHGGPGQGKSRLARELCKSAENAWRKITNPGIKAMINDKRAGFIKKPWKAGFIKYETERSFDDLFKNCRKPLLLVIDAAARRKDQVEKLTKVACKYRPSFLARFLGSPSKFRPVRIILIARSGDWLSRAKDDDSELGQLFAGSLSPNPIKGRKDSRRNEFKHALKWFECKLKELGIRVNPDKNSEEYLDGLLQMEEIQMLDIHIAALLTAYGDHDDARQDGANWQRKPESFEGNLLEKLVRREQKHWAVAINSGQVLEGKTRRKARYAVAWLGATNPSNKGLADRLNCLQEFKGEKKVRESIENELQELYPDGQNNWGGVLPERIATWLAGDLDLTGKIKESMDGLPEDALRSLLRHFAQFIERYEGKEKKDTERVKEAFAEAVCAGGENAFVAVTELVKDLTLKTSRIIDGIMVKVLCETEDRKAKVVAFELIMHASLRPLFALPKLGYTAAKIGYDSSDDEEELHALFAEWMFINLSDRNEFERALPYSEEALAIYRKLGGSNINKLQGMARILLYLSINLRVKGQPEKAIPYVKLAIDICRESGDEINLAISLKNLWQCLLQLEKPKNDEAYQVIKEAVTIYENLEKKLDKVEFDKLLPDFAGCRYALWLCMNQLEKPDEEELYQAVKAAVKILEKLEGKLGKVEFDKNFRAYLEDSRRALSYLERRRRTLPTSKAS